MARATTQHYTGLQGLAADVGSVQFSGTTLTHTIKTQLSRIVSVSFNSNIALVDAGSVIITTPSLVNGEYAVTGGEIIVTRSVNTTDAVLFYTLIGY